MIRVFDLYDEVLYRPNDVDGDQDAKILSFTTNPEGEQPRYTIRVHGGDVVRDVEADRLRYWSRLPSEAMPANVSGPQYPLLKARPVMHEVEHRFFTQIAQEVQDGLVDAFGVHYDAYRVTWDFDERAFVTFGLVDGETGHTLMTKTVYRNESLARHWSEAALVKTSLEMSPFDPKSDFITWRTFASLYIIGQLSDAFWRRLVGYPQRGPIARVMESGHATHDEGYGETSDEAIVS